MNNINLALLTVALDNTGSFLFHGLIDHHPEIISFAVSWNYYRHEQFFPQIHNRTTLEIINDFIDKNPRIFDLTSSLGYDKFSYNWGETKTPSINKEAFRENFIALCKDRGFTQIDNEKDFFELVHLAYALVLDYDISKIKYIFMHIHGVFSTEILSSKTYLNTHNEMKFFYDSYPDLKIFITNREPKELISSYLRTTSHSYLDDLTYKYKNNFWHKKFVLFNAFRYHTEYQEYAKLIPKSKQVIFVDNFTLHKLQDVAMKKIANLLDIAYNKSLCEATFAGFSWSGNAADGKVIPTFNKERPNIKWQSRFKKSDLYFIDFFTNNIAQEFGYKKQSLSLYQKFIALSKLLILGAIPSILLPDRYQYNRVYLSIKTKDDLLNEKLKKLPLALSKMLILYIYIYRNTKKFYKERNSIKVWLRAYKVNKRANLFKSSKNICHINDINE